MSTPLSVRDRVLRDEGGSVLVIVAVWMVVAMMFTIFVVDVGNWFQHQRHLQLQADAAAFAGGSQFQACFGGGAGDTGIYNEATKYAGVGGSLYNGQVGGVDQGSLSVLYQSKTYPPGTGGPPADDTQTTGPCTAPNMFDVKTTEAGLPLFFGGFGLPTVTAHARARVQLFSSTSDQPSLPLAPPDTNFGAAVATFINTASGAELSGCSGASLVAGTSCTFAISPGASCFAAPSLQVDCGSATIPVAAGVLIGMRAGIGSALGSCVGGGSATLQCFDAGAGNPSLHDIRGYGSTSGPGIFGVWPATMCAAKQSPFFSEHDTTTTCTGSVTALVNAGTNNTPPASNKVKASDATNNNKAMNVTTGCPGTNAAGYNSTLNAWCMATAVNALTIAADGGQDPITISGASPAVNGTVQQFYSGGNPESGPVQLVQITDPTTGFEVLSLPAGTATININVGIGTYAVHTPCSDNGGLNKGKNYTCGNDPTVLLRNRDSGNSSNHFTIDCGGGNTRDEIVNGCTDTYQVHPVPYTPTCDPVTPPDCANTQTGVTRGQIVQGMNTRFSTPNSYPDYSQSPGDPRLVILILTDFNAWRNLNGSSQVPVVRLAAFYVTGWDGGNDNTNEPFPGGGASGLGDIWGHFVKYVDTLGTPGTDPCDPASPTPCVPVLSK